MTKTSKRAPTVKGRKRASSTVPGITYRDDGKPRWQARLRFTDPRTGQPRSITMQSPVDLAVVDRANPLHIDTARSNAEAWIISQRSHIALHGLPKAFTGESWTLKELFFKFLDEVEAGHITHKSIDSDRSNIRTILGDSAIVEYETARDPQWDKDKFLATPRGPNRTGFPHLIDKWVSDLRYEDFHSSLPHSLSSNLKGRSGDVASAPSVARLLKSVQLVFKLANTKWGLKLPNPIESLIDLSGDDGRDRILSEDEFNAIIQVMRSGKTEEATIDALIFTRFTACRRSEVVKLNWEDIDFKKKTAHLKDTKGRKGKKNERVIPISEGWDTIERVFYEREGKKPPKDFDLKQARSIRPKNPVFSRPNGNRLRADTLTQAWDRARAKVAEKSGDETILTARLHDLRHTRITELGAFLTASEVAKVSGHKDLRMVFRYFNPRPEDIGRKIDAMRASKVKIGGEKTFDEMVAMLASLPTEEITAVMSKTFQVKAQMDMQAQSAGK